ncbi:TIGR02302 family protein [Bartonella ancashensis]|uniref:Methyl-accepting chemotaxis protein n=1 Tax=Bartonella ancashensis TaxID=1318743 RepID=A0A0M4M5A9_9HYPH|nr:TIGR02302 family protein [Bartonella ancashensis]ALE03217.1 Methyl-accepting chemotaxis protein [Bartonella ancashensis]
MRDKDVKRSIAIKLFFVRFISWCALFFERIWPHLLPFFFVLSLFCSLSWFGLFNLLTYWWHLSFLFILCAGAVGCLYPLFGFHFPTMEDVDHFIECKNGLKNQPLSVQNDRLCVEDDSNLSAIIWREHQYRMAEYLKHVKIENAYPNSAIYDPMAFRALFILLLVCAFSFSFGSKGGRLSDAFDLRPVVDDASIRIDAWVTPPTYTGVSPIYLTQDNIKDFKVPKGSAVNLRITNGDGITVKAVAEEDKGRRILLSKKSEKTASGDSVVHFEAQLEQSTRLSWLSRHRQTEWYLEVIKDQKPIIQWLEKPGKVLAGALELQYEMDDDYGVTSAFAVIEPPTDIYKDALPLYEAPQVKLLLARGGKGKMRIVHDLSSHPWAGAEVKITLVAEDGAGQRGQSETVTVTLPQRIFTHPIARAVSEQRRLLALDASTYKHVLDMLSALLVRPEDGIRNMAHFLVLQSAWSRLSLAQTKDELRDIVDYLWHIALGIEGGQSDSIQQKLKQAQAALRDALRRGASGTEIERLMVDLRQAMNDYIYDLSIKAPESDNSSEINLSENSLYEQLNEIEEMAQMGSSSTAENLLSEIEKTLDHLRVYRGNKAKGQSNGQATQMRELVDILGNVMRRQQEILNETHSLETKQRNGEHVPKELSEALEKRQGELQSELSVLEQKLSEQGLIQDNSLKNAEKKMDSSQNALSRGDYEISAQNQSDSLETLRQGAQSVLKVMREVLKKSGDMQDSFEPLDPLGHPLSSKGDQDKSVIVPQEGDRARARQILEEIRKRLSHDNLPEEEKNYLERLLRFH